MTFTCGCSEGLTVPLESAGQQIECPTCRSKVVVPGRQELLAQHEELRAAAAAKLAKHQAEERVAEQKRQAELIEYQQRAAVEREAAAHPHVPSYRGLQTAASVCRTLALICYVISGLAIVTAIVAGLYVGVRENIGSGVFAAVPALGLALGAAFQGFLWQVFGELISAFRDIAINSFQK